MRAGARTQSGLPSTIEPMRFWPVFGYHFVSEIACIAIWRSVLPFEPLNGLSI